MTASVPEMENRRNKTILNHVCRKATAVTVIPRMTMSIDNGVMERKEIQDTTNITAWFASDIPVSWAGPNTRAASRLILALDVKQRQNRLQSN